MIIICLIILTHYKSLASSTLKNTIFNHSSGFANVCTTSSAASHARIPRREKFILCEDRQRNVDHLVIQMITLINILHKDIIGPGGLRPPCVLACPMRSLAIVFTNFRFFFFFFFSLRLLLLTHFEETPMCEIICHPIFWHN